MSAPVLGKHARDDLPPARRVHPRHFHAGPPPPSGSAPAAAAAAAPTRVELHRHALESMFAFCDSKQLSYVGRACRAWRAASLSMAPLQWRVPLSTRAEVVDWCRSSVVRRHMGKLTLTEEAAGPETMMMVALTMPHLRVLDVELHTPTDAALCFPPQLQVLDLTLPAGFTSAAVNAAIEEISRLQKLDTLILDVPVLPDEHSFAPLARMPSLHSLALECAPSKVFTSAQIDQLRAITGLTVLTLFPWRRSLLDPRRLLAVPHQWRQLHTLGGYCDFTDESGPLLLHLPELTHLDVSIVDASCTHVDWLAQLPKLTTLRLAVVFMGSTDVPRVMAGLQQCTGLNTLELLGGRAVNNNFFTVEQLDSLLQHLPHLTSLTLNQAPQVTSLAFLTHGRIPHQLQSLTIGRMFKSIPAGELRHIHSLQALHTLHLTHDVFDRLLDPVLLDVMRPPTRLMPSLRRFVYAENMRMHL